MNGNYQYTAANLLKDVETNVNCSCDPHCTCAWPTGFSPLMRIIKSKPQLEAGYNIFEFANDGTYLYDACGTNIHNVKYNTYISYGQSQPGPSQGDAHFCGPFEGLSDLQKYECSDPYPPPPGGSALAFSEAALSENVGDYAVAIAGYSTVVSSYPDSSEAIWSMRGLLRTTKRAGIDLAALQINLIGISDETDYPQAARDAALEEGIWTMCLRGYYEDARVELNEIINAPDHPDSLWAEQMLIIVDYLDSPPTTMSIGPTSKRARVADLHDRIQELMGRPPDREVLDQPPIVEDTRLSKAYPNPFNSTINIELALPANGRVRIDVFNVLGRRVETLLDKPMNAGTHVLRWNANSTASGVYFYRLSFDDHIESHKILLLK
jgi:hypothetical protein